MEFLKEYHLLGLLIGISTFLIIGLFHPVVIKAEYYLGTRCWWLFMLLGVLGVIGSLITENILISALLGVFSFSSFGLSKRYSNKKNGYEKDGFPEIRKELTLGIMN